MDVPSNSSNPKHRTDVVRTVFPAAMSLNEYCISIIEVNHQPVALIQPKDSKAYTDLLHTSLIIPPPKDEINKFVYNFNGKDKFPVHDIVGRLISQLLRSGQQYHEQNCLTLGYRLKSTGSDVTMRSNNDTELYFVNTMQAIVCTQTWQLLANRIGEELLRHILKQPVFVQSANLCYLQVSGTSASELIFRESKRLRANNDTTNDKANVLLTACVKKKQQDIEALRQVVTIPAVPISDAFHKQLMQEKQKPVALMVMAQPIMRFKIFYNAQYVKKIGLPANHVFQKKRTTCIDVVTSTFLPALSLFANERAASVSRAALIALFETIKSAYSDCPLAVLMESTCSIARLSAQAESLASKADNAPTQEEAELLDTSGLFSTPATKSSMQICETLPDSDLKSTGRSGGSGMSISNHKSAERTAQSRESTWHSTASLEKLTNITLTNASEREMELTATSNATYHSTEVTSGTDLTGPSVKAASAGDTQPASTVSGGASGNASVPPLTTGGKKRKRGCRAGAQVKLQKQQLQAKKEKPTAAARNTENRKTAASNSQMNVQNDAQANKRTIAQEIRVSIDQLWKQHAQRELVTVGEKLVHSVVHNVKSDVRVQEMGINTQGSVKSILSAVSSAEKDRKTASTTERWSGVGVTITGALQGESESTYASAPSVVHRSVATGSDKKRKYVSIQESPLESADKVARRSRESSQQPDAPLLDEAAEFEYFVGSGTPSVTASRPMTQSTGDRSRSDLTHSQHLSPQPFLFSQPKYPLPPPTSQQKTAADTQTSSGQLSALNESNVSVSCPAQVGDILLRDCSRAKRKKIKFKFRQFFKKRLLGGLRGEGMGERHSFTPEVACSPILPESIESGLLHHLNRPFLTEARFGEKSKNDPRAQLFPSIDSPAASGRKPYMPSRNPTPRQRLLRAARLDALIEKSDLLTLCTPTTRVAAFVKSVCRRVFTICAVWGTRHNLHAFLSTLDAYVHLGRQETFTLALLCQGIRLSDIPWLKAAPTPVDDTKSSAKEEEATLCGESMDSMDEPMDLCHTQCTDTSESSPPLCAADPALKEPDPAAARSPLAPATGSASRCDSLATLQVFYRFLDWVYNDFVNPLLAANFYATEVEGRGAEVLYYRKAVWARIVQRGKQQLCSNFVPLVCTEEAHLSMPPVTATTTAASTTTSSSPTKLLPRSHSAMGTLPEHPATHSGTLQRAVSAPTSHDATTSTSLAPITSTLPTGRASTASPALPAAPLQPFQRAGSLLFNNVLQTKQYTVPSLAVENNLLIGKLPPPRVGATLNRTSSLQSARLKNFLQRLPVVRFVPKKSSVRAITNLRTKRINGSLFSTATNTSNISTRIGQQIGEVLTNSALYNCLHVLKSVYLNKPALIGFGAFGLDDIYLKLLKYKQNIPAVAPPVSKVAEPATSSASATDAPSTQNSSSKPQFFMAVLDLEKCYDNVDPQKLYDLLKVVLSGADDDVVHRCATPTSSSTAASATKKAKEHAALNAENVIHKFSVTHPIKSMDRNITKNVRYVASGGEIVPFRESSKEVAQCYPYSIVTDAVVYPKITNAEVLRLLKVHLFQHAVKIPVRSQASHKTNKGDKDSKEALLPGVNETVHQYFTQIKGIPQGSILSPILCTMYYGHAERKIFGLRESIELIGLIDKTLVIRLMDDYIVISTEQACVQHFLQAAHQSLKAYGAGVNPLKTRTNFDASVEVDGACIPLQRIDGEEMPWCGLLVNTRTLEVTCHFSRLLDRPIASSVLAEFTRSGAALRRAIKSFMRMKCHAIVLDAQLNSKYVVVQTLYTMYLIVAMRTYAYVRHLRQVLPNVRNDNYLCRSIVEGVMFGARLIHTRTVKKSLRKLVMGSAAHAQKYASFLHSPVARYPAGVNAYRDSLHSSSNEESMSGENDFGLFAQCVESLDPESFGQCAVTLQEANWLGLQAFIAVLNRRRGLFGTVVRALTVRQADFAEVAQRLLQRVEGCAELLKNCEAVLDSAQWL